jgi:hypothetical protein
MSCKLSLGLIIMAMVTSSALTHLSPFEYRL